ETTPWPPEVADDPGSPTPDGSTSIGRRAPAAPRCPPAGQGFRPGRNTRAASVAACRRRWRWPQPEPGRWSGHRISGRSATAHCRPETDRLPTTSGSEPHANDPARRTTRIRGHRRPRGSTSPDSPQERSLAAGAELLFSLFGGYEGRLLGQ